MTFWSNLVSGLWQHYHENDRQEQQFAELIKRQMASIPPLGERREYIAASPFELRIELEKLEIAKQTRLYNEQLNLQRKERMKNPTSIYKKRKPTFSKSASSI